MTEVAVQVPQGVQRKATLLDLLDRVLGKGVVAYGDIVLSIADLDLVYLNLRAVLSAIGTLEGAPKGGRGVWEDEKTEPRIHPRSTFLPPPSSSGAPEPWEQIEQTREGGVNGKQNGRSPDVAPQLSSPLPPIEPLSKLELDPKKVEQGLAKLVLTLINLLRRLMERQAIRRMEAGTLTPEQLERAGQAFKRLDERMKELREQFGLKEEDLNLDLGPLGELV